MMSPPYLHHTTTPPYLYTYAGLGAGDKVADPVLGDGGGLGEGGHGQGGHQEGEEEGAGGHPRELRSAGWWPGLRLIAGHRWQPAYLADTLLTPH